MYMQYVYLCMHMYVIYIWQQFLIQFFLREHLFIGSEWMNDVIKCQIT